VDRNSIFSHRERVVINYVTNPGKWGTKDEIVKSLQYVAAALVAAVFAWRFDHSGFFLIGYAILIYCIFIHIGATWEILRNLPQIIEKYEKLVVQNKFDSDEGDD